MAELYYYLHENGDLILKRELGETAADLRESDLVRAFWPVDPADRGTAWRILVEGLAAGARRERVLELASTWGCTDQDAQTYAERSGARLEREGDQWMATRSDFVNLQDSPAGFGMTALEAMADLCRDLGYRPQKLWGCSFEQLLRAGLQAGSAP